MFDVAINQRALHCWGCRRTSVQTLDPEPDCYGRLHYRCTECHIEDTTWCVHYRYSEHTSACGLDPEYRWNSTQPHEVTCQDCLLMMVTELSAAPSTPDWRPDVPVSEDYYAV
jgi:hypothetical protein